MDPLETIRPVRLPGPSTIREKVGFLGKFLESPLKVGSFTPSSHFLTNKMLEPVAWQTVRSVAELGAGTGVFTRAISDRISPHTQVLVFEQDRDMHRDLKSSFPSFHHETNAIELTRTMHTLGVRSLDCIISSLPLALFPFDLRNQVMDEVEKALKPRGLFVQFQYSWQMHRELRRRFAHVGTSIVPLNLPPAFVFVCQK